VPPLGGFVIVTVRRLRGVSASSNTNRHCVLTPAATGQVLFVAVGAACA
jgi:hypothetical protein